MNIIKTACAVLVVAAFMAGVLSPGLALAAACSNTDCTAANTTLPCDCGTDAATSSQPWCWAENNTAYSSQEDCENDMEGIPPADFQLGSEDEVPGTGGALLERIQLIANWVFAIFLAISLVYLVVGAFQFVTGGGDPAQISGARQKLIYAAIGIAIGLLVFGIPAIIRNIVV